MCMVRPGSLKQERRTFFQKGNISRLFKCQEESNMTISLKSAGSIYVSKRRNLALCRYTTDPQVNNEIFKIQGFPALGFSHSSKIYPELALGFCISSKVYLRTGTV